MGDETFESGDGKAPARRWRVALTWSGLLTAGVIIYELTNQPALGVAITCLKVGWEDFKTAYWLRRVDPRVARGRACWWAYVGWGLLKVGGASFFASIGITVGAAILGLPFGNAAGPARWQDAAMGAICTVVAGPFLSSFAALCAVQMACRNRLKIWLNGSVNGARRKGVWPPYDPDRIWPASGTEFNPESRLPFLASVLVVFLVASVAIASEEWPAWEVSLLAVATGWVISRWVQAIALAAADNPAECWPPGELAAGPDDPVQ